MRIHLLMLAFVSLLNVASSLPGQEPLKPAISVTSSGKATAKPDLALVFMTVRSSSPLAADALEQNNKKVQAVRERLAALGYKEDKVRFTGNRFSPAGGPGIYYGGGQRPTGFDVSNSVLVFIEGPELSDLRQFNSRVSTLLDELSKLGASPFELPISRISMGGVSVVAFTVKDPSGAQTQASQEALEKSRPIAEEIARRMKVQITGIESVSTQQNPRVSDAFPTPLDDLPYEYWSSSIDEVPVRVNLVVRYSYK
jgi:uncharacterized protein YggE